MSTKIQMDAHDIIRISIVNEYGVIIQACIIKRLLLQAVILFQYVLSCYFVYV